MSMEDSVDGSKALSASGLADRDPSPTVPSSTASEKPSGRGVSRISRIFPADPIGGDGLNPPDSSTSPLVKGNLTSLTDPDTAPDPSSEPPVDMGIKAEAETLPRTALGSSPNPTTPLASFIITNVQANPT